MVELSVLEMKLAEIKRGYIRELPTRMSDISCAWAMVQADPQDNDALRELHRLVHSLSGSGATFGFDDLSAKARALENAVAALMQNAGADRSAIQDLYAAVQTALSAAVE